MNQVFVYETLKHEKILEEALGENHGKVMIRTIAPKFEEIYKHAGGERWPTLIPDGHYVKGDVIQVSDSELAKLDAWEDRYERKEIITSQGKAWAYFFKDGK